MHPISFDLDYERERNRLTVFFRLLLAIPWMVVVALWGIAVLVALIVAWFAMLFTGRYPAGLYGFVAGFLRFSIRAAGFALLATDRFPTFSGGAKPDYPVHVDVAAAQPSYHRAKTAFKLIVAFPIWLIASYAMQPLVGAAAFVSWWRIVFTGRQSATMHDALRVGLAYNARANGFLMLLTEIYPRPLELPEQALPADAPGMPPAAPPPPPPVAPPPSPAPQPPPPTE